MSGARVPSAAPEKEVKLHNKEKGIWGFNGEMGIGKDPNLFRFDGGVFKSFMNNTLAYAWSSMKRHCCFELYS